MENKILAIKRAAQRGDRDAQFQLACMYRRGEKVRRNRVAALKWFILAAGQGDPDADIQVTLLGDELSDMQERRAIAGALRWKFANELKNILQQLLAPETTIHKPIEDEGDLPTFIKLPSRLN